MSRQRETRIVNTASREDYTTDFARDCEASQREFGRRGIDDTNFSCAIAQSEKRGDNAVSRQRETRIVNTASREDYTTDFARDCEASQREFGRRGIDDTNFSCAIAQSEKRGDNAVSRQRQARTVNARSHEDYTTDYAREYDASNQEFDQKRIRSRGRQRCNEQATADLDSEDCVA